MSINTITVPLGATPGTAVPISSGSEVATSLIIQAYGGDRDGVGKNQGKILIGPYTVTGSNAESGIQLAAPTDGVTPPSVRLESGDNLNLFPLNQIYIAGYYADDKVVVMYHTS